MSAKLIEIYSIILTFLCIGFVIGVMAATIKEKPKESIQSYSVLEQTIDRELCQAKIIDAIVRERMRLTGKPNP